MLAVEQLQSEVRRILGGEIAEMTVDRGELSVPVPRNMTVFRASNGELVLYSVIAMHDEGMRALESLGKPAVLVIPHRRHQMDAAFFKSRYPDLRVLAPSPSRIRDVKVDGGVDELSRYGAEGQGPSIYVAVPHALGAHRVIVLVVCCDDPAAEVVAK